MKTITVPVLEINKPTSKGVVYPLDVVRRAVAKALHKKFLCKMMMPNSLEFGHHVQVDASHVVEGVYIHEDTLFAELRVLDTEYGKMLTEMLEKLPVKFNAAGTAEVRQRTDGYLEVTDFTIIGVHVAR